MNIIKKLVQHGTAHPPVWLPDGVSYLTMMGSFAYGVSDDTSDRDVYGFCFPPVEFTFPHLAGEIPGFGRHLQRFEQYQEHHLRDPNEIGKTWDITVYSIVKYFDLVMQCNPNMIDSLFTPPKCVMVLGGAALLMRENRHLFLSKKAWHTFKGYAYQQMHKMDTKAPTGARKERVEEFGMDTKYCYHLVRLLDEVEQILTTGTLDLEHAREQLKAIRRGEVPVAEIKALFYAKEKSLETAYAESKLPHTPREAEIKVLLMQCLEHHYGTISQAVAAESKYQEFATGVRRLMDKLDSKGE
jgi:predicted nucleotidyltransferase